MTTRARMNREGYRVNKTLTTVMIVCSLTVLVPLYLTVVTALKSQGEIISGTGFEFPGSPHWENFVTAWKVTDFPRTLLNTTIVTAGSVLVSLIVSSMLSYAIARHMRHPFFRGVYVLLMSALFIPFPIVMLPIVKEASQLGLDNQAGLILLHVVFVLTVNMFLYVAFIRAIPIELEEAARIDGATTWQVFWRVVFPLLAPMNATIGILVFLHTWNDFLLPLVILSDPAQQTLPLAQFAFQGTQNVAYGPAFASYLMAMAPVLVVYLFSQRWVLSGVMRGSVK
jgi:raffinose/stachyose/melibiose transport system permease protein